MLHTSDWPVPEQIRRDMGNLTTVTELILLGLSDACELQMLIFLGLLLTYLLTLLGNLLIVIITLMDRRLHTPMYYFLRNFAVLEIWFTSVIFPKMLTNILTGHKTISLAGSMATSSTPSCTSPQPRRGRKPSQPAPPTSLEGEDRNKVVALLNTVVTPMLNPFIYTLRNKQVKQVFRERMSKLLS
ncbi:Olfactory receptor 49 [Camelus dromedarius]|uniref:Olfactory receptor 49 n=1 Tax=Camelus dromedarius TaxID=9838 RepID=A0A5N4E1W5_CAMDR|nr:Olfactory receptor 49 [Camelus dromedarius]